MSLDLLPVSYTSRRSVIGYDAAYACALQFICLGDGRMILRYKRGPGGHTRIHSFLASSISDGAHAKREAANRQLSWIGGTNGLCI